MEAASEKPKDNQSTGVICLAAQLLFTWMLHVTSESPVSHQDFEQSHDENHPQPNTEDT